MSSGLDGLLGDSTTVHACGWMHDMHPHIVWLDLAATHARKPVDGGAHNSFGTPGKQ